MLEYTSPVFFFLVFLFLLPSSGTEVWGWAVSVGLFHHENGLAPNKKISFSTSFTHWQTWLQVFIARAYMFDHKFGVNYNTQTRGATCIASINNIHEGQYFSVPNNGSRLLKRQTPASIKPQSAGQGRNNQSLYLFICSKHFIHSSLFSILSFGHLGG